MIPTIFYQCWDDNIPKEVIDETKKHIQNYDYKLFSIKDMQEYLKEKWGNEYLFLFNKYRKIAHKVDLWRYCILYDTGGVYMDADCILKNNIDFLLDRHSVFVTNNRGAQDIFNGFIMSVPKNPVIKNIIDYMLRVDTSVQNDYYFNCKELYTCVSKYLKISNLSEHHNYGNITILIDRELNGRFYPYYKDKQILVESNSLYPYKQEKGFYHAWIGASDMNTKIVNLPGDFEGEFILNENQHTDTFEIVLKKNTLVIKRTDKNTGWGYPHSGFIKYSS